jgi:predicted nucleic acid-binding protein
MYVVDSSVWVALFSGGDVHHAKAVEAVESIGGARIVMPYGVLLETATVLARKISKDQAYRFVEYARANPQIETFSPFISEDVRMFLGEKYRLSFVDALLK